MYKSFIFTALILFASHVCAQQPGSSPVGLAAEKLLREMPVRMYDGSATETDLRKCEELYAIAPSEDEKRPFLLLGAQYQRMMAQKPENSLAVVLPSLLGREKAANWIKENQEAFKIVQEQWKKDAANARKTKSDLPAQPSVYQVKLPPLFEWEIGAKTAPFAIEAAACLAALDEPRLALEIIEEVGQKYSDESRVLSAECGADLFLRMKMYEKSIEFYRFALDVLGSLRKREYEPGIGERVFFSEEQAIIVHRVRDKLRVAERLFEEEKYGAEWLFYREAQRLQRDAKYLDAYCMYDNVLRLFPDTVYAEAAKCYQIEILCKLADPDNVEKQGELSRQKQEELKELKRTLALAERFREPAEFLRVCRNKVEELELTLKGYRNIPSGANAVKKAESMVEEFLGREKYGLYRGEAMLYVGLCYLEQFLNPDKGKVWMSRAAEWMDDAKEIDDKLSLLEVPDKALAISAPPKTERYKDHWGNSLTSKPKPGEVFNRRTASWYWGAIRKEVALWQGLLAFSERDYEQARKHWSLIAELDAEYLKELEDDGWSGASTYHRLMWNLENQPGCLYATPKEMAVFRDKRRRFAVLIGDLCYESEQREKALRIFRKIDNGDLGELSLNERSYVSYAIFACLGWVSHDQAIAFIEPRLQRLEKTVSGTRIIFGYANLVGQTDDKEKTIQAYETCIRLYPKSHEADSSLYYVATEYFHFGNRMVYENDLLEAKKAFSKAAETCNTYISSKYTSRMDSVKKLLSDIEKSMSILKESAGR